MKVTIIGAGNMGAAFAKQLSRVGHQVSITARSQDKLQALASLPGVKIVPAAGAVDGADVIIVATSYEQAVPALRAVGKLSGKTILDITNPLTSDYMGLTIGYDTSAAEEIAKAFPEAAIVKGFNTVFAQVLGEGADFGNGQRVNVFVASDADPAKQTVAALAESLGFAVVDAGGLKNARYLEPLAGLNIYFGYGAGLGTGIAPAWMHKAA